MARPLATGPHKDRAVRQMRATAALLDEHHPEMMAGDHLRDAATVLASGRTESAKRHLDAAMFMLTPQSLIRHGITDDDGHADAKHHMHHINRLRLNVEDIEDIHAANDRLRQLARARRGQPEPAQPFRLPPPVLPDGQQAIAASGQPSAVIDLRSDAWKGERRDRHGQWTGGGFPARAMMDVLGGRGMRHQRPGGSASLHDLQRRELHPSQRKVYDKLRKRGTKHKVAYAMAVNPGAAVLARGLGGSFSNTGLAVELARQYRYRHGWIKLADLLGVGSATEAAAKGAGMPLETRRRLPTGPAKIQSPSPLISRGWTRAEDAGGLHGKQVLGTDARGSTFLGTYQHPGKVVPRHGEARAAKHVREATPQDAVVFQRAAARRRSRFEARHPWRAAANYGLATPIELRAAWLDELRDPLGRWSSGIDPHTVPFGENLEPGSNNHLRAIEDLGNLARWNTADGRPSSDTLGNSLHHLARALALRDMKAARIHMASARWADQHEAGYAYQPELDAIERSIGKINVHRSARWMDRSRGHGPHAYLRTGTPINPTRDAMRMPSYASMANRPVELSARTPMLERTPAPRGRPGGPGLYRVKGMGHTAYLQQVVRALIEERGMPPGKAYAIARARIRRWAATSRHPEVRAAATRAEAGEIARQARAKSSHAASWDQVDRQITLAAAPPVVIELFNPYHAPTGQFTTASGAGAGQQGGRAAKRKKLVREIASLHRQIAALRAQLPSTRPPSKPGKSKRSTPAKKGAGAQSARQARQGKQGANKQPPGVAARKTASVATIHAKILALRAELQADIAALRKLT